MKNWTVEVLNKTVEDEIRELDRKSRAKFIEISKTIINFGLESVGMPHIKPIKNKIWEIRAVSGRLLYATVFDKRVVILHAFEKKSNRLPAKNLDIAIKRLKLLEERGVK